MARSRTLAGLLALTVLAPMAACSLTPPEPDDAAKAVAAGLAGGDLTGAPLRGTGSEGAAAFVKDAYAGMGDKRPKVEVVSVTKSKDDSKATAKLRTSWKLSDAPDEWTYESEVKLELQSEKREWQATWDPTLVAPGFTGQESLILKRKWPRRADIVDAAGQPLVSDKEVFLVGIDKTKVPADQAAGSATTLANLVGVNPDNFAKKVTGAGAQAFVQAVMLRADDPVWVQKQAQITAIPGGVGLGRLVALGPSKTFAQPLLGGVGEATAEQVDKSGGVLAAGDEVGTGGLEAQYDTRLRGTPGLAVQAVKKDKGGNFLGRREVYAQQAKGAEPLKLSLSTQAQTAAEQVLAGVNQPAALAVVRASTGEVLAVATSPSTNNQPLAHAGKSPPGSTFKIISSLAFFRKGNNPESIVPCTQFLTVNGRQFKNYNHYPANKLGDIPLHQALAFSCNTAYISQHQAISQEDLTQAAQALGMGQELTLGFPNFMGSVPKAENPVEHAVSFIGQGRVEASPLAMATVVASVIKGETVRPVMVPETKQQNPAPPAPLTQAEAQMLRDSMAHVVSDGSGRQLQAVGVQYAKTGTAEYGTENPPKTHGWMVAGRGDIALAAYIQDDPNGTTTAGPVIMDFLKAMGPGF